MFLPASGYERPGQHMKCLLEAINYGCMYVQMERAEQPVLMQPADSTKVLLVEILIMDTNSESINAKLIHVSLCSISLS